MNNLALVYIDLRQLDKARECFMLILQPMEDWTAGSFELATTYGNLALVEALAHNKEKATEYVCKAEKSFRMCCHFLLQGLWERVLSASDLMTR